MSQTVGQRRVYAALHASNSPCEDVGSVSAIEIPGSGDAGCLASIFDGHGGEACDFALLPCAAALNWCGSVPGNTCSVFMGTEVPKQFQRRYAPREKSPLDDLRAKFFAAAAPAASPVDAETVSAASALADAFSAADNVWLSRYATQSDEMRRAGSCAIACYCEGSRMVFANAGDCRAVLGRRRASGGERHSLFQSSESSQSSSRTREPFNGDYVTVAVTRDHTAKNASEQVEVRRRTSDPMPFRDRMNSSKPGSGSRKYQSLILLSEAVHHSPEGISS